MPENLNLVFISLDCVRADHLGCYGYTRGTSPNIDALAEKSILFEQMIAAAYFTLPSHASMLSGLHPVNHGAEHGRYRINADVKLLAQRLKAQGFRTAGLISNDFVSEFYGFNKGFDYFRNFTGKRGERQAVKDQENARKMVDDALAWVEKSPKQRFFLFMHVIDAHAPYSPPEEFCHYASGCTKFDTDITPWNWFKRDVEKIPAEKIKCMLGLFDGEIAFVDQQMGRLFKRLEELNLLENTLLVVTADHGEQFKEHNGLSHFGHFWEEVLRVPLIFHCPTLFKPQRVKQVVRHVDLVPSIMDFLGLPVPPGLDGVSLRPAVESNTDLGLHAFSETKPIPYILPNSSDYCVRTDEWKYFNKNNLFVPRIRPLNASGVKFFLQDCLALGLRIARQGGLKQQGLYNLKEDPLEKRNLLKEYPEKIAELRAKAKEHYAKAGEGVAGHECVEEGTDKAKAVEKRLEALGYLD